MEEQITDMLEDLAQDSDSLRGTRVVCRTGSTLMQADLRKVSVSTARSIVVLAEGRSAHVCDSRVLRVVLGLCGCHIAGHIVVEVSDIDNEKLVRHIAKQGYTSLGLVC